ncbi:MAG: AAA family ATPase [Fusobacterium sp.]|nr:AAA family ATPase [Fusobacterium sp.]
MNKKEIGLGTEDFKEIIQQDYFYFDKTKFIEEVLKDKSKVKLFTRPRRFGKTLNISMLNYFFDIRNKEENRELFKGLYIENSNLMGEQGRYPVISLNLKDIKSDSWERLKEELGRLVANLFREHLYVLEVLDEYSQEDYRKICAKDFGTNLPQDAILFLSNSLYKYYNQKVILLIDEYDTPLVFAHENNYYKEAIDFFRGFYGSALKGNISLEMGVLTGIIRVSNENIFSGLNNIELYSILEHEYADCFGLTSEEVKKALEYYGVEESFTLVKEWYNGYKFGEIEIYNTLSILKYLKRNVVEAYWINTSANYLIRKYLSKIDKDTFEGLEKLFNNRNIEKNIDKYSTLNELVDMKDIWKLMLFSGYLTVEKYLNNDNYLLKIPNKEVHQFFKKQFLEVNYGINNSVNKMLDALINQKIDLFEEYLQEVMKNTLSYNDVILEERYYHLFVLTLLIYLDDRYYVKSNKESGYGRYDIAIIPKDKTKVGFILEFKVSEKEENMENTLNEAIKQIEEKEYSTELNEMGIENIVYIAFAFHKKIVKIKYKKNY